MGPVLGIETGTATASLGLVDHGQIRAQLNRELPTHCSGLPDAVAELLRAAALTIPDLAAFAVGLGPGSFTGLRVGLSYAKGLAAASGKPLVGVPSLDAIAMAGAEQGADGGIICPVLDGRHGEVYAALYRRSGDALEKLSDDRALPAAQLDLLVADPVLFIGGPAALDATRRMASVDGSSRAVPYGELRGVMVAVAGALALSQGGYQASAALEPRYVGSREIPINSALENRR
ncbi:MAG TPA: tRNA (adenosine(37)-N6)-threonylcarbamoyltransferase complex dimerization subunit type 1 TsaB [Candidatus Binataceae bacterium]|nr:tRNA (adenosine(37)-N6)-threonylcarbamoyltransferase complex dimerization subunit type 1 TsaB [Candidatus Binataceae bacterium]